jgi:hypothetical protein
MRRTRSARCACATSGHAAAAPLSRVMNSRRFGSGRDARFIARPTGSPEAVARLRLPQNVACGFTALRSSAVDSQHCKSLQLRVREAQLWSQ